MSEVQEIEENTEESATEAPPVTEPAPKDMLDLPYSWENCVVSALLVFQPADGDPGGREVNVAVRTHLDAPIIRTFRLDELRGHVEDTVWQLLDQLQHELPQRAVAAAQRKQAQPAKPAATGRTARNQVARGRAVEPKKVPVPPKQEQPAPRQVSMFDLWGG